MKKGFIKGEALRLLRTNSSQVTFERNIRNFHNRLLERGYPAAILGKYLSEVKFADRNENSPTTEKQIRTQKTSTFCYTIPPGFTEPEENTYGEMAPYTKLATTKRNL